MYGYPSYTADRKPTEAQTKRLQRLFPDAIFAWNNRRRTWDVLQPVPVRDHGLTSMRWKCVMCIGHNKDGTTKEIGEPVFLELQKQRRMVDREIPVPESDPKEEEALRDERRRDRDAAEELARKAYKPVVRALGRSPSAMTSFAGVAVPTAKPAPASPAGFKTTDSGLIVPGR